jgi:hypothetical protein
MKRLVVPLWVGIALFCAPLAHADGDDVDGYIGVLNHEGLDTTARSSVIHMGRMVCEGFDKGLPFESILSAVDTNTGYTKDEAEWVVAASVTKLCPEHKGDVHD